MPREVEAGERLGWIGQADLERYGPVSVLHAMVAADVSALVIDAKGDLAKSLVESAQKEGVEAYVTATLEVSQNSDSAITEEEVLAASNRDAALLLVGELLVQGRGQETAARSGSVHGGLKTFIPNRPRSPSVLMESSSPTGSVPWIPMREISSTTGSRR